MFDFRFSGLETNVIHARHRTYEMITPTTGSSSVGELAKHWYQQCRGGHVACCHPTRSPKWYPPRLIDVRTLPTKVVLRQDVCYGSDFAALSHCWGKERFLTLSQDRLAQFQLHGIPHDDLPVNFRDAIVACRALGIPYLWIDSLCIFQSGDASFKDWAEHVKIMKRIYSESDVCISTAAAASATQSCFRERDVRVVEPAVVMLHNEPHLLVNFDHATRGFRDAAIASRAWVLQERLLSRRILTYGRHQIHWECTETQDHNVCETFPAGIEASCDYRGPFSLPSIPVDVVGALKCYQYWLDAINLYSECQLTRADEDKFAAIAGIAEHMQTVFSGSLYIAGFFEFELPMSLLWHVRHLTRPDCRPQQDRLLYRAPSWSWAALDAPVRCYSPNHAPSIQFASLKCYTLELMESDNPFSQLLWADITIHAPRLSLRWQKQQGINGRDTTVYRLSEFEYHHNDGVPTFHFDSLQDCLEKQEDVSFLPIVGDGHVTYGLIVRPVPACHQTRGRMREEEEQDCAPRYRRIGMATIYDDSISDKAETAPKRDTVLI
jgi:hypothetical protein